MRWRSRGLILAAPLAIASASCGRVTLDFPGDGAGGPDGDAGAPVDSTVDADPTACPPGKERCGTSCVTLASDPLHCGACDQRCDGATPVCDTGECRPSCTAGLTSCAGACVDLKRDPDHCGDCTTVCADGLGCDRSACVCLEGQILCGRRCVDTATDRNNCGACGRGCPEAAVCGGGVCQ